MLISWRFKSDNCTHRKNPSPLLCSEKVDWNLNRASLPTVLISASEKDNLNNAVWWDWVFPHSCVLNKTTEMSFNYEDRLFLRQPAVPTKSGLTYNPNFRWELFFCLNQLICTKVDNSEDNLDISTTLQICNRTIFQQRS